MNAAELSAGLSATPQYRYADRLGNRLFVAGQVPLDSHGELVGPDNPSAQALQCLRNLERLLAVHEYQVADIRQLVVYVVGDQASLAAAWSAVASWFGGQVPPATLLGVAGLGYMGQLVEIDTTVIKA
jgi:enamine deaminase RidA (YjgF/YER057c/UK114 family)